MKNRIDQIEQSDGLNKEVAITGLGVFGPNCPDSKTFSSYLHEGESVIGFQEIEGQKMVGGFIDEQALKESFCEQLKPNYQSINKLFLRASKSVKASLLVAFEAWQSAGLFETEIEPLRVGVVVAGSNISNQITYQTMNQYGADMKFLPPRYALDFFDTSHIGAISEMLPIQGESLTVGGASASGNVALMQAEHLIRLGVIDTCVVVGAMADLSPLELNGLINIGAYGEKKPSENPKSACRPFDRSHQGFILGQSAACVILENKDRALKRNAEILAYYIGGAQMLDRTSLTEPNTKNQALVMQDALKQAGISPASVNYINAHGTSTPAGDISELNAIKEVFGADISRIWLNSTKALFGHCFYSAGVLEAVACVVQMRKAFVHGMPHLSSPVAEGFLYAKGKEAKENQKLQYVLSNSYGFTGINTTILLRKG